MKYFMKYSVTIGILVLFDQFVKLIIYYFFYHNDMDVIGNIIRFHPVINTNLSWGGNYIVLLRDFEFTVILNMILIIFMISSYSFYRSKKDISTKIVNLVYVLGMAGSFSSLIDKVIWKGSLDYIQIPQLFIFDIKDIYLSVAEYVFIFLGVKHCKEISGLEYIRWCLNKIKRLVNKKRY